MTKCLASDKSTLEKIGVRPGERVALVALDDDAFARGLADRGARVSKGAPRGVVDVLFFGAREEKDLARVAALAPKIAPDGALWIVRPEGKDGVAERATFAAGQGAGLVDVKVVRYSETHTANKFVVPVAKRAAWGARVSGRRPRTSGPGT